MDSIIKDLETIRTVFEKHGVEFLVVYGALLGYYRDGKLLPDDDDIDLAVIQPVDYKTRKQIGWELFDLGFQPQDIAFNVYGRMEPSEIGYNGDELTGIIVCKRNFKFTIFFFYEEFCPDHGPEYVCIPKYKSMKLISSPKEFYDRLGTIKINGKKYKTPGPIKDYLAFTYFDNWKDKTDRRHGHTYYEMHAKASLTKEQANSVQINENIHK